jgi:hypothetical protein
MQFVDCMINASVDMENRMDRYSKIKLPLRIKEYRSVLPELDITTIEALNSKLSEKNGLTIDSAISEIEEAYQMFNEVNEAYQKGLELAVDTPQFIKGKLSFITQQYENFITEVENDFGQFLPNIKELSAWPAATLAFHATMIGVDPKLSIFCGHFLLNSSTNRFMLLNKLLRDIAKGVADSKMILQMEGDLLKLQHQEKDNLLTLQSVCKPKHFNSLLKQLHGNYIDRESLVWLDTRSKGHKTLINAFLDAIILKGYTVRKHISPDDRAKIIKNTFDLEISIETLENSPSIKYKEEFDFLRQIPQSQ